MTPYQKREKQLSVFSWPAIYKALGQVEGGSTDPKVKKGAAGEVGPLQITQGVLDDVNERSGTHYTPADCLIPEKANAICMAYIKIWFPEYKVSEEWGKRPIAAGVALIWHHGPSNGWGSLTLDEDYGQRVANLYDEYYRDSEAFKSAGIKAQADIVEANKRPGISDRQAIKEAATMRRQADGIDKGIADKKIDLNAVKGHTAKKK